MHAACMSMRGCGGLLMNSLPSWKCFLKGLLQGCHCKVYTRVGRFSHTLGWGDFHCTLGWGDFHCTLGWGDFHCTLGWGNFHGTLGWGDFHCTLGWGAIYTVHQGGEIFRVAGQLHVHQNAICFETVLHCSCKKSATFLKKVVKYER